MKKLLIFFTIVVIIVIIVLAFLGRDYFSFLRLRQIKNPLQGTLKIRYYPAQAQLQVNNRSYSSSSGVLNVSLPPGNYHLYLSAPGYSFWEQDIHLAAQEIKKLSPVFLFPIKWPQETLVTDNIAYFYPSADYNQFLYITKDLKNNWCLYQRQNKEKKCFWTKTILPKKVIVSPSFRKALIKFKDNDWQIIFLPPALVSTPLSLNASLSNALSHSENIPPSTPLLIKQALFSPNNENELIVRLENQILLFNFIQDTVQQLYQGETSPLLVINNKIYFVAANGLFRDISLSSSQTETLSLFSFSNNNLADIKIKKFPHRDIFLILDNSHRLYLLKPRQNIPLVVAENIQDMSISPSGNDILLWNNNKIIVCSYPQLIRTESEIHSDILPHWFLNDNYFLINNGTTLNIYNPNSKRTWPLATDVQNHTFYYDPSVNYLFYLSPKGITKISL